MKVGQFWRSGYSLGDLGVTTSHSPPHTSNVNPFWESQFRTLKCQPDLPDWFANFEDAQAHGQRFMTWHDERHVHSSIGDYTLADVHYGQAEEAS